MKRNRSIQWLQTFLICLAILALLTPYLKHVVRSHNQATIVADFLDTDHSEQIQELSAQNESLQEGKFYSEDPFQEGETTYHSQVHVIGILTIPKINETLTIYDRTNDIVLSQSVGVLDGTHYPVGKVNQTSVLTGHRGTDHATIFENLDQLAVGDYFIINNGINQLTYEVYDIKSVLPDKTDLIQVVKNQDTVILLTCDTPNLLNGLNTHRLLLFSKRIPNKPAEMIKKEQDNRAFRKIPSFQLAGLVGAIILVGSLLLFWRRKIHDKKKTNS